LTHLDGNPSLGTVHATQQQLNSMASKCEETGESVARAWRSFIETIRT